MGPLSYLPSGLPETIGQNILPYSIGDRGSTENTEWDTLQFVKVGSPMERLTKMYVTSPESWATWLHPPYPSSRAENPFESFSGKKKTKPHFF